MVNPITRCDVLWGYAASSLNIGAGLILLPVILRYLPSEDVGLWFVFITLASLAQLLEMGFQPTVARNAAYVYAGAQTLNKVGLPSKASSSGQINKSLLDALVNAARCIYQVVAFMAALVLLLAGTYYISTLLTLSQDHPSSLLAWVAFASGYVVNFYYGYINGLLQGRGDVTQANKVIILSRSLLILLGSAAVALGFGLVGLGIASLISAVAGRIAAYRFFYILYSPSKAFDKNEGDDLVSNLLKMMWHNASRLGAVQIGAFFIQRGNTLIASSFLGLAAAASYGMTVTVLMALSGIAMVICQVQVPHMNTLQSNGDKTALISIFGEILLTSWLLFVTGLIALLLFGDNILYLIGSSTYFLPSKILFLFGIIALLEMNHSIAGTYLTTTNKIPFVNAALFSGLGILVLAFLTINFFGVIGLILSQGLVQLVYNNWKWPLEATKNLDSNFTKIIKMGALRVAGR